MRTLGLDSLVPKSMVIATNFGICVTFNDKTVFKTTDWVGIQQELSMRQRLSDQLKALGIDPDDVT